MGMEQRGSRFYYYEKRREGRRVVSTYIGGGALAGMAAEMSAETRQEREQQRQQERKLRYEQQQLDRQFDEQARIIATTTDQRLRLAGFHKHKGQWRKRRIGDK
jgi:hypothetical protein